MAKNNAPTAKKRLLNCKKTNSVLAKMKFYIFLTKHFFRISGDEEFYTSSYKIVAGPKISKIFLAPKNCKFHFCEYKICFFAVEKLFFSVSAFFFSLLAFCFFT